MDAPDLTAIENLIIPSLFHEFAKTLFFEPSGGKLHAPDSIFMFPMPNSRILAPKPLASSCLGGNREAKSIFEAHIAHICIANTGKYVGYIRYIGFLGLRRVTSGSVGLRRYPNSSGL